MNRYNTGNVITNGMQVLSVGATTAGGVLQGIASAKRKQDDASTFLNNTTEQERQDIKIAGIRRQVDEAQRYIGKGSSPFQHMSVEESSEYQKRIADKMKAVPDEEFSEEQLSVDDIMENSEQIKQLKQNIKNNAEWLSNWTNKQRQEEVERQEETNDEKKINLGNRHKKRR